MNSAEPRVLINMSNIHGGGALQVAISFVTELLNFRNPGWKAQIFISEEIYREFNESQLNNSEWEFHRRDVRGLSAILSSTTLVQRSFDLVFTLFGPNYNIFNSSINIVGFAQPWILDSSSEGYNSLSQLTRAKFRIKFALQKFFFQRADIFLVELEHVKKSLVKLNIAEPKNIFVVYNALARLYLNSNCWKDVAVSTDDNEISIGYITRDYPHKNIRLLAEVASILNNKYHMPVRFYFSLTRAEWSRYRDDFGDFGRSVGALSVYQCPRFYEKMDAIIFPSLLECFSASPLEALAMRKPLFASDRDFVKNVCQGHAIYFDPLDPESIAQVVFRYFDNAGRADKELERGRDHVLAFSDSRRRCSAYLNIIKTALE